MTEKDSRDTASNRPPVLAERLLSAFTSLRLRDSLLGDFTEVFETDRAIHGERRARLFYWANVLAALGPLAWRWLERFSPLIWAGLVRKPVRTILSFLSIVVAFVLFGILSAMDAGFTHQLDNARLDRWFVAPRFGGVMPLASASKIAALPGVIVVTPRAGIRGYYRDMRNPLGVVMSSDKFFEARPEMVISKEEIETFARTRTGLVIGVGLTKKYGWKVGDKVPIITNVAGSNGNRAWTFDVVAVADNTDFPGESLYLIGNYEYLNQARTKNRDTADLFLVRIKDPAKMANTVQAIDALFTNSPQPTRSTSDKVFAQTSLQSLGDIKFFTRAISSAVLFMLLFLTANTMMQSVRERIPELALLKTLGFSDWGVFALVLAEAGALCLGGAVVGLMLVKGAFPILKMVAPSQAFLLFYPWYVALSGLGLALVVAIASGLLPALRVKRMAIVDALANR